jgi:hypothetical protein
MARKAECDGQGKGLSESTWSFSLAPVQQVGEGINPIEFAGCKEWNGKMAERQFPEN